uniref:Endonuclease/exonuclease/phosphatase domain-containing protein n=1 Tax=Panagrolaimus sp. ES5 TaxID=591445 RepID=A0AC34FEV1_9BILA
MGKARDHKNPADRSFIRKTYPRISKKQPNQQNHQPQKNDQPTLRNKKKSKEQNRNNCNLDPRPFGGRLNRKRHHSAGANSWGTPIPEKVQELPPLSPVKDENGVIMSKSQLEQFYRTKVDGFNFKIPSVSNYDSLPTKNILAIVAGLTGDEPSSSAQSTNNATDANDESEVIITEVSSTRSSSFVTRTSPRLPKIVMDSLEEGEINDDDIICLSDIKRKKKRKPRRSKKNRMRRLSYDVIQLDSDDNNSIICLDDDSSENGFANLSITTERVQETVASSKEVVKSQNGIPNQVILESQRVSKTTVTTSVTQCVQASFDRLVRHYRRSLHPMSLLAPLDHLDSLSFYTARNKKITLRGPEFVGLPPLNIDVSKIFRVLSYNVLCQATMERCHGLYKNMEFHPEWFVWQNRWNLLSKELINLTADIYCLQEVERDKVAGFYEPLMVVYKRYQSFYAWRGDDNADGCAIFWNPEKFESVEKIIVRLNLGVPNLDRPNVAQILRLKHRNADKELIVVNTHILFNPKRGDVKLYQLAVIFANIQKIRTKNQPIIFCGDFNLEPDSLLYNFITKGELDCTKNLCYPSTMSGQKRTNSNPCPLGCFSLPEISGVSNSCSFDGKKEDRMNSEKLHHMLNFESAYGNATFEGHRIVSTYHQDQGNPDFIFYSVKNKIPVDNNTMDVIESDLFLCRRLSLPDGPTLERFCDPFPNEYTGSDHIPLYAEFFLC